MVSKLSAPIVLDSNDPPTNLTAKNDAYFGIITVTWKNNTQNETGIDFQRRRGDGDWEDWGPLNPGTTQFRDSDSSLWDAAHFVYRIRAQTPRGPTSWSNLVGAYSAPFAPTSLYGSSNSPTTVTLTWDDHSGGEQGYQPQISTDGYRFSSIGPLTAPNAQTCTISGLQPNTDYTFNIVAVNKGGKSQGAIPAKVHTMPAGPLPAIPTGLKDTFNASRTAVTLNWTYNSTISASFRVERSEDKSSFATWQRIGSVTAKTFTDTQVSAGHTYYYRIVPVGTNGDGGASDPASATVSLAAPTNLSPELGGDGYVDLHWIDNSNNETGFHIYRKDSGQTQWVHITDAPAHNGTGAMFHSLNGMVNGKSYSFKVSAYTDDLESATSNVIVAAPEIYRLVISGAATTSAGQTYWLTVSKGAIPYPITWTIRWGDGTGSQVLQDSATMVTHVFNPPAPGQSIITVMATATDSRGVLWYANDLYITWQE
jgi:hypothetical protein